MKKRIPPVVCAWLILCAGLLLPDSRADAPPDGEWWIKVADTPNDDGRSLTITWWTDPAWPADFTGTLLRHVTGSEGQAKPAEEIGPVPLVEGVFVDESLSTSRIYKYELIVQTPESGVRTLLSEPLSPKAQWFNREKINILLSVVIFTAAIVLFINLAKSGQRLYIRKIAGLEAVEDAVGRATELGRPVFHIPGIGTIGDVATLASLSIMRRVAKKAAEYATPFKVPCCEPLVMTTAQEVVKVAYAEAGRPDLFRPDYVRFLTNDQFGYAAGVDGMMMRERPGAILLLGWFMAESLILAETGNHIGAIQIAGTDQASQLPFFVAACDYTLIGEELYAASSYLDREPVLLGSIRGQDLIKAIFMVIILVGVLLNTIGSVSGRGSEEGRWPVTAKWFNDLFHSPGGGGE